jgi:hypothetical protein
MLAPRIIANFPVRERARPYRLRSGESRDCSPASEVDLLIGARRALLSDPPPLKGPSAEAEQREGESATKAGSKPDRDSASLTRT